ncbi:MAG: acetylglutamate kinase, partial [Archaeoglobaceae archaeon]
MHKVNVLAEALPYIRDFHGSCMVIKMGGHAMVDKKIMESTIKDILLLYYVGIKPVIVHGGGPEISHKMEQLGIKPKYVDGLRVTDKETMEVVEMVLDGKVNSQIISTFIRNGGKAVGISGKDGLLIIARKKEIKKIKDNKEVSIDLGHVGETEYINPEILEVLTDKGLIPVISPVAADLEGETYNINADIVAGNVAAALKAKKLIMLTDVPGLLENPDDDTSVISQIKTDKLEKKLANNELRSGMIPKAEAIIAALKGDVERAHIINGSKEHSLLLELLTREGTGTM